MGNQAMKDADKSLLYLLVGSMRKELLGRFTIDHPRDPEAIDEHAETRSPKRLLERNYNFSVPGQFVKKPFGLIRALDMKRE
jgi:hypothetical protein